MNLPAMSAFLRRVIVTTVGTTAFALLAQWIYADLVSPLFSYSGYTYLAPAWTSTLESIAATTVVALILPSRIRRPSHVILWLLFVICVAPSMLVAHYTGYLTPQDAMTLTLTIGAAFAGASLLIPRTDPVGTSTAAPQSSQPDVIVLGGRSINRATILWTFCIGYSLLTYSVMAATIGLSLHPPALDDIYSVRAEYTDDVGSGGLLGYLLTGQAYVVNTIVLARGLARRNWTLIVLAIAGQALIYSGTGFKAVLFSFPAVILMAILMRKGRRPSALWFLIGPSVLMLLSSVADTTQQTITWTSIFARRFILTPGLLTSVYTDYFQQNPVARYGYSFLGSWNEYPYDLSPPKRIGQYLVPGSSGYANANLFADGFANFGWAGIVLVAGVLVIWLRVVDRLARGLPLSVTAIVLVMPSVTLSNTSIFTAMLSHGLVVGTLLLAIAPRRGWGRQQLAEAPCREPTKNPLDAQSIDETRSADHSADMVRSEIAGTRISRTIPTRAASFTSHGG